MGSIQRSLHRKSNLAMNLSNHFQLHKTCFTDRASAASLIIISAMTALFITTAAQRFHLSQSTFVSSVANKCPVRAPLSLRMASSQAPNGLPNGHSEDKESSTSTSQSASTVRNVLGGPLELCCNSPRTGFYRDGFCHTGPSDFGVHTVCCRVTQDFLQFSRTRGNDLISPAPQYGFPGLKEGDGWCVCASRWLEAAEAGHACPVVLASTHIATLQTIPIELLREHAIDLEPPQNIDR